MNFLTPNTLQEALKLRNKHQDYKILAGGTDLYVLMNGGFVKPDGIINIWNINGLSEIKEEGEHIYIGALATHTNILNNELIKKYIPMLAEASSTVGARQIQNRGTIGGNIMNASPAGDTLPPLMAYDAEVKLSSSDGDRWIEFTKFYTGYRKSVLKTNEILTEIKIKKAHPFEKSAFMKIGTRRAQAISKIMGAFRIRFEGSGICCGSECGKISEVAISYGSVAAIPIRAYKTEEFLKNKSISNDVVERAIDLVRQETTPIDDIRSSAAYRLHTAKVLLKRFLESF